MGWNTNHLPQLLTFLEEQNTKSFIILHNGHIVVERYFNNHTPIANWYWASAGKTLTTTLSGIAQDEGLINTNHKVSNYIGAGWTCTPQEKEALILCKNLLSMNSGLDDTLGDSVAPEHLQYLADAQTRWAYHNVYVKRQDVIAQASNTTWANYINTKLRDRIGMNGSWISLSDLHVYWSNTRSMARFGLMVSTKGQWENTQIVSANSITDTEATTPSQEANEAYGYLWWLNGKSTCQFPQTELYFSGALTPNAPEDIFCALGKNDQKIYIVPSHNLVIVRMGDAADNATFGLTSFDTVLWEKMNLVLN